MISISRGLTVNLDLLVVGHVIIYQPMMLEHILQHRITEAHARIHGQFEIDGEGKARESSQSVITTMTKPFQ